MTELDTLQHQLMADVAAAADEQAIEALRVAALGKKGSVSELLKTLGTMSPEERQTRGAAINAKDGGHRCNQQPQVGIEGCGDHRQTEAETVDVSLRCARPRPSAAASIRSARS